MKITILLLFLSICSYGQNWETNFENGKKTAILENKNIILVFSGSDWCAPCIKLEKNIWSSDVFKTEAKNDWILVKADFPKKKASQQSEEIKNQNAALAELYNKEGNFPLVVILDKNGKVLGKTGFKNVNPEEYIHLLHTIEKKI